jgi:anthranilate synthase component 1
VDATYARLRGPLPGVPGDRAGRQADFVSNFTREGFMRAVERAVEYIRAGDVFQVVPSQRLTADQGVHPFAIYRALRSINPSPYLGYLDLGPVTLVSSSPESLVRSDGREQVETLPIAGTRPRGATPEEDAALAEELLGDAKERAEHVMLVDLGRNDLGRVCRYGSVKVTDLMRIERYSHVMHIVSTVQGRLAPGRTPLDALASTLPMGTASGAPKIRAMEIIDELEPVRRGPYAGAFGYLAVSGAMDMALTLRTVVVTGGKLHLQAGCGVVADSDPAAEWQESINKLAALRRAVDMATEGLG